MINVQKISNSFFKLIDDEGETIHTFEKLGILMDKKDNILHKFGSYDLVKNHFYNFIDKFRSFGCDELANDLVLLDVSFLEQEEIDKIINICDYCGKIYNKYFKNNNKFIIIE